MHGHAITMMNGASGFLQFAFLIAFPSIHDAMRLLFLPFRSHICYPLMAKRDMN